MPTIAIIDDRKDNRDSLKQFIEVNLPKKWKCVAMYPYDDFEQYSTLLHDKDKDIAVIVVDEKLHETASKTKSNVNYTGTELAKHIRRHFKEFPIYLITSFLDQVKGESVFEDTFERGKFRDDVPTHVERMVRAGARFFKTHEDELSAFSDAAARIASGHTHKGDKKKIAAIQKDLGESISANELSSRAEWLCSFEKSITELKTTIAKLKKKTEKKK